MGMKNQVALSSPESDTPGSQVQEELRNWLEKRLDILGVPNPSMHSRLVLNFLQLPDLLSNTSEEAVGVPGSSGGDDNLELEEQDKVWYNNKQRKILVNNLKNLCEQKYLVNMLVDELYSKIKKLRELCLLNNKQKSKRFTDELINDLVVFVPEDDSAHISFPTSQVEFIDHPFRRNNQNFLNNNTEKNNINLHNLENGRVERQRNEKIVKPVHKNCLFFTKYTHSRTLTPTIMEQNKPDVDVASYKQLYDSVFNENVESIWHTTPSHNGNVQSRRTNTRGTWASSVWPQQCNSLTQKFIRDLTSASPLMDWHYIYCEDCPRENRNSGHYARDSHMNVTFEEISILMKEPKNHAGHNIWSFAAGEMDISWIKFLTSNLFSTVPCVIPGESDPIPVLLPLEAPSEDRKKDDAFREENLPKQEDVKISARTHFRPIKNNGEWADGTTFPIDNSFEKITYRRSESGHLYLPGSETPYTEYRESNRETESEFVIRFHVRQHNKAVQTDDLDDNESNTTLYCNERIIASDEESERRVSSELDSVLIDDLYESSTTDSDTDSTTDSETDSETDSKTDSATDSESDFKTDSEEDTERNSGSDSKTDSESDSETDDKNDLETADSEMNPNSQIDSEKTDVQNTENAETAAFQMNPIFQINLGNLEIVHPSYEINLARPSNDSNEIESKRIFPQLKRRLSYDSDSFDDSVDNPMRNGILLGARELDIWNQLNEIKKKRDEDLECKVDIDTQLNERNPTRDGILAGLREMDIAIQQNELEKRLDEDLEREMDIRIQLNEQNPMRNGILSGVRKLDIGIQVNELKKQKDEDAGSFDIDFPPLEGHDAHTSRMLMTAVPVHYTGERKLCVMINGRRISTISTSNNINQSCNETNTVGI